MDAKGSGAGRYVGKGASVILVLAALLALCVTSPNPAWRSAPVRAQATAADLSLPLQETLAPLGSNLIRVWWFDNAGKAWYLYDSVIPEFRTLTRLRAGQAYWVKVDHFQRLTIASTNYDLFGGWNIIAWQNDAKAVPLKVNVYQAGISLTAAEVDNLLSQGTAALQTNDGAGDVPTFAVLVRDGPLDTFAGGLVGGIVNSDADFAAVSGIPGEVKVVNRCGAFYPGGVLGCAYIGGTSLAVIRYGTPDIEGLLWAHELGHNRGLDHNTTLEFLMYPQLFANDRKVNQTESGAFLK
ncbi:MAG: hypothetical protein FJ316_10430 [SAR202 cluster bacterium]|nr:hypothetical protein [SAR202 cluster bacterium]